MTRVIVASTLWLVLIIGNAEVGLAGPMLAPPSRVANAFIVLGDSELSDGGPGSLSASVGCCGAAPGHLGANASSSVDFGTFSGLAHVFVEDFTPPALPFLSIFPLDA